MKTCVFAGTFDPFTLGHYEIVRKCLTIYDKVFIAVGINSEKQALFSLEQRLNIISKFFENNENVEITSFSGLLVDFMREKGIKDTVRGIRDKKDYQYETIMKENNKKYDPTVNTIFIFSDDDKKNISSTVIKELIKERKSLEGFMPDNVISLIQDYTNKIK